MKRTSEVAIREARVADEAVVGELLVDAFVSMYSRKKPDFSVSEARRAELRNVRLHCLSGRVLVGERKGMVIGTVTIFIHSSEACHAWDPLYSEVRFLAVRTAWQGQGLGAPLMDAAQSYCRAIGSKGISIRVRKGLDRLVAFYERRGFKRDPRGDLDAGSSIFLEGYSLEL